MGDVDAHAGRRRASGMKSIRARNRAECYPVRIDLPEAERLIPRASTLSPARTCRRRGPRKHRYGAAHEAREVDAQVHP